MSQGSGLGRGRGRGRGRARNPKSEGTQESASSSSLRGVARGESRADSERRQHCELEEKIKSIDLGTSKGRGDGDASCGAKRGNVSESRRGRGEESGDGGNGRSVGRGGTKKSTIEILKTRPEMCLSKKGTSGRDISLLCNYFELKTVPNWVIYQYRVDFNIEEEREGPKKKWLREHADVLGRAYIFDGAALFTSRRLTQDNKPLTLTSLSESHSLPVLIEIRLVQQLNYGSIVYLQVFNILVRRSLDHLKLQLLGRNYFDAASGVKVPKYNLEIWPGYVTSIRQNERNILMCSEITHKIIRKDTALDLLIQCSREGHDYRRLYQQAVVGETVLTYYNNKNYRVDDVDFSLSPSSKFKLRDGQEISFVQYYEQRYKIRIADLKQPMLVSRSSARSIRAGMPTHCLLVPELCRMTGLSKSMLENNQLKRGLAEYTRITPLERIDRLKKFNQRLTSTQAIVNEFKLWDMTLSKDLLSIPARELPPEIIVGGNKEKYSAGTGADWTRELRMRPMLVNGVINNWAVICPYQLKSDVLPFLDILKRSSSSMCFHFPPPQIYEIKTDKISHYLEAVEECLGRSRPDLIMFICPNNKADRYNAIKKKCCVDRGVPSQVVLAKNVKNRVMSVATKIAIQINCKIGGAPWSVEIPLKSFMVVGYDACHDSHSKGKSYGAVVASLNNTLSSWFSVVTHHSSGEELSNTLPLDVCKALRKYYELNGHFPAKIFVYRDGVGEGQISHVCSHEVNILKQRLTEMYGGETWNLGYIIVSKRINTRLFKSGQNPVPGTVVDDVITLPERYDFYLVSQNVNVGTVTPTSYNVVSDNLGLKPDQIQRWTYKMTHLYYNWSGTIRIPAPCQYAHKLAFMVAQSLHVQPHYYLDTTLHFL